MERPPVWLMRQAGRTDPNYLKLKENCGLTLEEMFSSVEVATKVSLLPMRLGIDAIIFFQDILTITTPMGAPFLFRPGPTLSDPIRHLDQVNALKLYDVEKELSFVPQTLKAIQRELDGEMPVLGFAGAPFTLACFLINGQSFMSDPDKIIGLIKQDKALTHKIMEKLTDITIDYLLMQAEAGVLAVQLFESAAFLLQKEEYEEFALPYQQRIFSALSGKVPTIGFAHGFNHIDKLSQSGADIISLPSGISINEARAHLGKDALVQGNVSNTLLVDGSFDEIRAAVDECVKQGGKKNHIFNLGHGLKRETPFEKVQHVVQCVKDTAN